MGSLTDGPRHLEEVNHVRSPAVDHKGQFHEPASLSSEASLSMFGFHAGGGRDVDFGAFVSTPAPIVDGLAL